MKPKHLPTWSLDSEGYLWSSDSQDYDVARIEFVTKKAERLILAAPEMLEALKHAERSIIGILDRKSEEQIRLAQGALSEITDLITRAEIPETKVESER
jgi:hypothetical protein